MSNPEDKKSATQSQPADSKPEPSLEEQLATAETRRRDTQSGYTKGQQTIKAQTAEIDALKAQLADRVTVNITKEEQEALEEIKFSDPVEWRNQLNALEDKAKGESSAKIAELTGEARTAAEQTFELDRRQQVLKEFNESAELPITDELIANDVPPRITAKLAKNEVTFEEFLEEVAIYVKKGKVVASGDETLEQPNMGKTGGGPTPKDMKPEKGLSESYSKDLY